MNNLLVITGPTASGKTALAIEAAKKFNGEIINADSMQIYKYMDIGTAKPTVEERENIPHHMLDVVEPWENFSVAEYCKMARKCVNDCINRKKLPILTGGTGLYIDSITENIMYTETETDFEYRDFLTKRAKAEGNNVLYDELKAVDPECAAKINLNDTKRIVRALEVYKSTGKTVTLLNKLSKSVPSPYNSLIYIIDNEREMLYNRIDKRVDRMIEAGLLDEVKKLLAMGTDASCTSMQAIGYKEMISFINGEITFEQAVSDIKQGSRRYAKRQLTWFRRNEKIIKIKSVNEINISGCV